MTNHSQRRLVELRSYTDVINIQYAYKEISQTAKRWLRICRNHDAVKTASFKANSLLVKYINLI